MNPEQLAPQQIYNSLEKSGWRIQEPKSPGLSAGRGIALREVPLLGRTCDYLLLARRRAVGIVEANPEGTGPPDHGVCNRDFYTRPQAVYCHHSTSPPASSWVGKETKES